MPEPVVAIVVAEVFPGKEAEFETLAAQLFELIRRKDYGTDRLLRSLRQSNVYYDIRDWASQEAAEQSQCDPELQALRTRLAGICKVSEVIYSAREVSL
ncbi:MAG: antibiotic biosynthesis monooxygenase family protein [Candidatus Acidiferrales bacterium]